MDKIDINEIDNKITKWNQQGYDTSELKEKLDDVKEQLRDHKIDTSKSIKIKDQRQEKELKRATLVRTIIVIIFLLMLLVLFSS